MVSFSIIALCVVLYGYGVSGLDSNAPPGDNFDLSNWKITLPDSSASEKSPAQLEAGYESQYFYTGSDGAMVFYVKGSGGTTSNAKYPRSEFRQLCNPTTSGNPDRYNWKVSSGNYIVSGKYKIGSTDSSSRKIVIQQIHAYDGPPLVKLQWQSGKVYALVKTDSSGNNENKYTLGSASQGTKFLLKTQVKDGYLSLYFNSVRKQKINVKSYWSKYGNYFKAGNYLQSSSSSAYAYVHIYYLQLTHVGSCSYTSDSFTYDDDSSGDTASNGAIIATVVIIVLILCFIGGYCFYKKKYLPSKGQASFKESTVDDNKQSGDTQAGENEDGGDAPNTTEPAYDMNEIEVEVEVEVNE